jgi:YD repeat-containing protein
LFDFPLNAPSDKHLTSVKWADGRTISYIYESSAAGNRADAMTEIAFADETHRYFTYDELGRVTETHGDDDRTSVSYRFGDTPQTLLVYEVYSGDNLQGTVHLNEMGLASKIVDAKGHTTSYFYDEYKQLVKITDEAGNETLMQYDKNGNVVWTWHDPKLAGSIHGVIVLDDGIDTGKFYDETKGILSAAE